VSRDGILVNSILFLFFFFLMVLCTSNVFLDGILISIPSLCRVYFEVVYLQMSYSIYLSL
jgi:hypothetical protein